MLGSRNFRQVVQVSQGGQSDKKTSDVLFLVLSLFYRSLNVIFKEIYHEGSNIFQGGGGGGGGVQLFPGWGGVQLLIPYINPYNL